MADIDNGFVMTPMTLGLRLTTGAEFASRDAPPTPVQIGRVARWRDSWCRWARRWKRSPGWAAGLHAGHASGDRPGAEPRGLWLSFGHAHHGFTLGPVTGRLLASLITGEAPDMDPAPYALRR